MRRWWPIFAAGLVGCAVAGGPGEGPREPADREEARRAVAALEATEERLSAGAAAEAADRADSLFGAWGGRSGLEAAANRALWLAARAHEAEGRLDVAAARLETLLERVDRGAVEEQAVRRLLSLRASTGEFEALLELALLRPTAVDVAALERVREAALRLSPDRLEAMAARHPPRSAAAGVVHAEVVRHLVLEDRTDSARVVARGLLGGSPAPEERRLAELVLEAGMAARGGRLRLGALLPLSGELAGVGELLREGIELAVDAFHAAHPELQVEVVYADDESDPERAAALVGELEAEGVLAVVGPLRSESFAAAVRARRNPRLLLVSPTATEVLEPAPAAYALWDGTRRARDVARALASWTAVELRLRRMAVLRPVGGRGATAEEAFRAAAGEHGGRVVAAAVYDPSLTSFEEPIARLAAQEPDAVFVPGTSPSGLLTLVPQLPYFGLDHSVLLGDDTWADPAVVRGLDPPVGDMRVVGTFVDREAPDGPWQSFKAQYEEKYRKLLRNGMLPALAHDAAALALAGMGEVRLPLPGAVSGAVDRREAVQGVTGRLTPRPATSRVSREVIVRVMRDRALVEARPEEVLAWLERARFVADSIARARADSIARADSARAGPP